MSGRKGKLSSPLIAIVVLYAIDSMNAGDELSLASVAWMPNDFDRDVQAVKSHAGIPSDSHDPAGLNHVDEGGKERPCCFALGPCVATV